MVNFLKPINAISIQHLNKSMKNKSLILISISILILIVILCMGITYWYFNWSKITTSEIMSESRAIATIKNTFPELNDYPSDQLPPRSIKTEKADNGWYVGFVQEGSGRPIISAKCFFVDNNKSVAKISEFNPNINDNALNISPKTCTAILPNDNQTEKPAPSSFDMYHWYHGDNFITGYLLTQKSFSWKTTTHSRNFCVIENLNPKEVLFPLYVWVRCGEFILQNGELQELSGSSGPAKINYPNELSYNDLSKMSHEAPRDGSLYSKDIKTIFPLNAQQEIIFGFNIADLDKKLKAIAISGFENTYTPVVPAVFNLIFRYGVGGKNELDTFKQTYTKDMATDPPITIKFKLLDNEMAGIYQEINARQLFDMADELTDERMFITPCSSYYLKVQMDSVQKELSWDDCRGKASDRLKQFTGYIISIIESNEEYKKLPAPRGGYL